MEEEGNAHVIFHRPHIEEWQCSGQIPRTVSRTSWSTAWGLEGVRTTRVSPDWKSSPRRKT